MTAAPLLVTAAVIRDDAGQMLIARRRLDSRSEAGKWEFPGGKVEFGEHPRQALEREIREELDCRIEAGELYELVSHVASERHIVLLFYFCRVLEGEPRALDVEDVRWVTAAELASFDFAAADLPVVRRLQSGN